MLSIAGEHRWFTRTHGLAPLPAGDLAVKLGSIAALHPAVRIGSYPNTGLGQGASESVPDGAYKVGGPHCLERAGRLHPCLQAADVRCSAVHAWHALRCGRGPGQTAVGHAAATVLLRTTQLLPGGLGCFWPGQVQPVLQPVLPHSMRTLCR